jgi:hypothetical protein
MSAVDYIVMNPSYIFILLLSIIVVSMVMYRILKDLGRDDSDNDQNDGDGGIEDIDPDLDLPPGVSLPVDRDKVDELVTA